MMSIISDHDFGALARVIGLPVVPQHFCIRDINPKAHENPITDPVEKVLNSVVLIVEELAEAFLPKEST
jgi:hypothetical protein